MPRRFAVPAALVLLAWSTAASATSLSARQEPVVVVLVRHAERAEDGTNTFAARLRGDPGRHVVFGHFNTTPALVEALGGDPGGSISEGEYDRLYVVVIPAEGPVTTLLLRFGAAWRS